jgi:hypothetical protein
LPNMAIGGPLGWPWRYRPARRSNGLTRLCGWGCA